MWKINKIFNELADLAGEIYRQNVENSNRLLSMIKYKRKGGWGKKEKLKKELYHFHLDFKNLEEIQRIQGLSGLKIKWFFIPSYSQKNSQRKK